MSELPKDTQQAAGQLRDSDSQQEPQRESAACDLEEWTPSSRDGVLNAGQGPQRPQPSLHLPIIQAGHLHSFLLGHRQVSRRITSRKISLAQNPAVDD